MNYGLNKQKSKRKQFLLKLLAIVMVISMMPYQALTTAHAAPADAGATAAESTEPSVTQEVQADPEGSDQDSRRGRGYRDDDFAPSR